MHDWIDPATGYAPHERLGWAFPDHHRYLFVEERIGVRLVQHTNRLGLPVVREPAPDAAPHALRVLVLGDTAILGHEHPEERRLPRRLEDALAIRTGRDVEVYLAAARNHGPSQMALWYEELLARGLDPDLVVWAAGENHARRSLTFHESGRDLLFSAPILRRTREGAWKRYACPATVTEEGLAWLDLDATVQIRERVRGEQRPFLHLDDEGQAFGWRQVADLAGRVRDEARSRGAGFLAVTVPGGKELQGDVLLRERGLLDPSSSSLGTVRWLRAELEQRGIALACPLEAIARADRSIRDWYLGRSYSYFSARGIEAWASWLATAIVERGLERVSRSAPAEAACAAPKSEGIAHAPPVS